MVGLAPGSFTNSNAFAAHLWLEGTSRHPKDQSEHIPFGSSLHRHIGSKLENPEWSEREWGMEDRKRGNDTLHPGYRSGV